MRTFSRIYLYHIESKLYRGKGDAPETIEVGHSGWRRVAAKAMEVAIGEIKGVTSFVFDK